MKVHSITIFSLYLFKTTLIFTVVEMQNTVLKITKFSLNKFEYIQNDKYLIQNENYMSIFSFMFNFKF